MPNEHAPSLEALAAQLPILFLFSLPSGALGLSLLLSSLWTAPSRGERREPPLWTWREPLLLILANILTQIVLQAVVLGAHADELRLRALGTLVAGVGGLLVTWALLRELIVRQLGQPLRTLGLAWTAPRNLGLAVLLCVLLLFPISLINVLGQLLLARIVGLEPAPQSVVSLFRETAATQPVALTVGLVFLGVVLAPVVEETVFRGLLHGWLRVRWGARPAGIVSAAAFAAAHANLGASIPLFFLGLVLSSLVERTGSLLPAMTYHAFFNGLTFALLFAST